MHRLGHYGAALLAYAPVGFVATVAGVDALAVGGAALAAGLSMLPDWDRRVPFLAHRGITHTAYFAVGVGAVVGVTGVLVGLQRGATAAAWLGLFGYLVGAAAVGSHVAADALTPAGVSPFNRSRVSLDLVRADSRVGNYLLLALGVGATVGALAAARALV